MNSSKITISEASSNLKISVDTLRRWEKKGLIKAERDDRNNRVFDVTELERAHQKYINGDSIQHFEVLKDLTKTEYKTVELFAGAGGLALGMENAGLEHELLVEIDKSAAQTLIKNRPDWNVICGDAKDVSYQGLSADIVTGGFPCQSFSYAGKQLGFEDARGTLFFELARAVNEIRPRIAVGENVKGLLRHNEGKTLKTMVNIMEQLGYRVSFRVLRSQYLDVPQKRERLIILCVREDTEIPFIFPKERDYTIAIRDALQNVPFSEGQKYPEKKSKILALVPPGGYWRDLPLDLQKEYMGGSFYLGGGKTGMARRLSWDEPSLTLTCAPAQKQTERCHPEETRPLTIREYARIQSFPDEWKFEGSLSSQYKQIGNAVPVNLGYHLGKCLIAMLDGSFNEATMEFAEQIKSTSLLVDPIQNSLFENELETIEEE
ncbi:MAG: DNA (cytosine-5-)-methyltransferase [Betaproteobacteria bacterium]|nr:DNA (cytosine-5-)-methyltransferase [Planctomycetia bacterium]NBY62810.1 DNA (cytosine-5-)-methyltransferase [Betaproteobacteria bacterium]